MCWPLCCVPSGGQIIATDGLWEFVSDREAIELAAACKDPQQAVDALIREANDRWMREEQVRPQKKHIERDGCLGPP